MRYAFAFVVILHGFIHLMGFAKAFGYGNFPQLTKDISKTTGVVWLAAALLLIMAAVLFLVRKDWWWFGIAAAVVSQAVIFTSWHDARFGTIVNLILIVAAVLAWGKHRFEQRFFVDSRINLARTAGISADNLTEQDLAPLPAPVQKYLRYVGVVGKPRVYNFYLEFEGEMRQKGKDWFPFHSKQYDFFDRPTRLFFMKGHMFGVDVPGYHAYKNGAASMEIKPFGLIPVVDLQGGPLNKTETVTMFNDLCLFAPAALTYPNVRWEVIDETSARAFYNVNGITIKAELFFNEKGQLVNFVSDDRMDVSHKGPLRFSTPVYEYTTIQGLNLCKFGEGVWHYPEGAFAYGRFRLKEVRYNVE